MQPFRGEPDWKSFRMKCASDNVFTTNFDPSTKMKRFYKK